MTRAVRSRILKDVNGDISDHLRNHIHLTNCIHLKNHMHKHSPILADRSLIRDLIVLQRSRSLRDPSASPPSWHSPFVVDLLAKKGEKEKDATIQEGRSSVGSERPRRGRRLSISSPTSKVAPGEVSGGNDAIVGISDWSSKVEVRDGGRVRREDYNRRSIRADANLIVGNEDPIQGHDDKETSLHEVVSRKSVSKDRKNKQKGKNIQDSHPKTLLEQLDEMKMMDSDDVASSNIHPRGIGSRQERSGRETEAGLRSSGSKLNSRAKRRKFRAARRNRAAVPPKDSGAQNELSVASNSLVQGSANAANFTEEEEEEEYGDRNVTRAPGNGCGIPWNWSRIHHRGRSFLDMAGRSFSCGLSERRGGPNSRGRDVSDLPMASGNSSSSTKSEGEALPLLLGSQDSNENAGRIHDYSGELGIYADHLLKHGLDSDLASEGRSRDQTRMRGHRHRHQNLTQKYMPRSFRDLVGQNLVAQALSNAIARRKIGLLYVFHGPHGTGKTSCARIFARALNCQSSEHRKPCGYCSSCIAYDVGKSRNIKEVGPVSNFDFENIMDLLDNMILTQLPAQYRVFIFDDCDTLSHDCWSVISKVIDRAPRRVVFVLVCSSLDVLPHMIISRCQKFFFPKLKDADIIYTLQWISTKEDIEIDKDAVKLIASRSDGSLRDALMTLEQLSLLGQRVSVVLVQELVGLISDEKLVDLLDMALSADTVNTVKNLRVIMETGVEPLGLMSQLATVITDILAGSYDFTKDRHRRKFFRRQPLSKEEMEKLRQALKTLSEAEKQLRMSNDKLTWLTAALLQLAPDQQYILPNSSAEASCHSPLNGNNVAGRDPYRKMVQHVGMPDSEGGYSMSGRVDNHFGATSKINNAHMNMGVKVDTKGRTRVGMSSHHASAKSEDGFRNSGQQVAAKNYKRIEDIWLDVLNNVQIKGLKEFLYQEGKLMSVSFGTAPTVQLLFSSQLSKTKAEKFRGHILQAFESVLRSPLTIEIRCESKKDARASTHLPLGLPAPKDSSSQRDINGVGAPARISHSENYDVGRSEIVEVEGPPREPVNKDIEAASDMNVGPSLQRRMSGKENLSRSIVRGKVSLAHVIQQAEGSSQRSGWSSQKAISIAEKLEQENLRLEPRSRGLLCWKTSRSGRTKFSRLKIRRRPYSLLKLVSCGRCLSGKSRR